MKCRVCSKEAVEKYCELHLKAYENILKKYKDWKRAMEISWKEYLNMVAGNPYSGLWVKEVAEKLNCETKRF